MVAKQQTVMVSTGLIGMKEIRDYYSRSEATILLLIQTEGFPAVKIGGGWESDRVDIDNWRRDLIAKRVKTNGKRKV